MSEQFLNSTSSNDTGLDWIEQGLTSHSTHCRSFRRWWGDCGISQDYSHSQSPQCDTCTLYNYITLRSILCSAYKELALQVSERE